MDWRAAWRRCWRIPAITGWIAWGLLLALLHGAWRQWRPQHSEAQRARLMQHWMRGLLDLLPLDVRYLGAATRQPALWLCNHISWLDIVVLAALYPQRFVSKSEVADWPLIGQLARAAGTLFIRRGSASGLQPALLEQLQQGHSVILFAEGTTTSGDRVAPLHGRLLSAAQLNGSPLQPVALGYYRRGRRDTLAPFIGDDHFHHHLWRLLGSAPIQARVQFLPALATDQGSRQQLADSARQDIAQALAVPLLAASGRRRNSPATKACTSGIKARKSASNPA
ncbi:lysophospholipid acyltransferase family protein [Halopseudomonas salegens]|uniref:Lyso-ornithine lipid acyltransferase n=1 Tax=Halopseudomonas salegens TaxID=1434072 RepID=A0A1H2FWW8_9GAMM|nr:lysophospholipid acyltransferase family protein [Halopseudomonas salegens]SDU11799.1 lyso-ornithine lipid acyltransferase [Halopseudomonas salegens]